MHYKYYTDFCVCNGVEVYLPLKTLAGEDAYSFPLIVYDVNLVAIGVAEDKEQYINIWNSSSTNRAKGVLSGLPGPFSFTITVKKGQIPPAFVIGDDCALLVDIDGNFLVDADGNYLSGGMCAVSSPIEYVDFAPPEDFSPGIDFGL